MRKIFVLFLLCVASLIHAKDLSPITQYAAEMASAHRLAPASPPPILGIGGCAGVGKTHFSLNLKSLLQEAGVRCIVLHLDHFNLSVEERRKVGTEWDPSHLRVDEVHRTLRAIASGSKRIEKPFHNQITAESGMEVIDLTDVDLILFDGIYTLSNAAPLDFFQYCAGGIYLESEEDNITAWKWEREQKKTHKRTPEQFAHHMEAILLDFHENIMSSKQQARLILTVDSDHHMTITQNAHASKPGPVVLITGASRGIGLATAELLAQNGYRVYATIRGNAPLSSHPHMHFIPLDVTKRASIQRAVEEILAQEGRIDILINNAGYALGGPVECLSIDEIQEEMDVNFYGVIRMCQEVLPHMRAQKKGHIINISSEQGVYGQPYGSAYTASKAALESLSEALSIEVLPWNIPVSIVEPGHVETDFTIKTGSRALEENPYQKVCDFLSAIARGKRPIPEHGQTAEEVALAIKNVVEDPHPKLRYQTSANAEKTVAQYITDISGEDYTERMRPLASDFSIDQ
ncbi:MAG: SDR family NAD(P)-dependent oxidoreductase [Chlamydiota bacterium]